MNILQGQSLVSTANAFFRKGQFAASIAIFSQREYSDGATGPKSKDFRKSRGNKYNRYDRCADVPKWPSSSAFNQITSQLPVVSKPAEPLVREIVEKHIKRGKTIVMPWGDEHAIKLIIEPFQNLLDRGVDPDFLVHMCLQREEFFRAMFKNGQDFVDVLASIKGVVQMSYQELIIFAADWADELAKVTPDDVNARLRVFLGRGVEAGKEIRDVIKRCPMILFDSSPQNMDTTWEVLVMCCFSPHICLIPYKELELRYEYIYGHMGIEPGEFLECRAWPEMPLKEIMMRHSCIKKTGKYVTPDEKRPQLKMENPAMKLIFDTNDQEFAGVAGIRKEEWLFYKQVFQKQEDKENKERPYEKIKPSVRKMYERRLKEDIEKLEGEL